MAKPNPCECLSVLPPRWQNPLRENEKSVGEAQFMPSNWHIVEQQDEGSSWWNKWQMDVYYYKRTVCRRKEKTPSRWVVFITTIMKSSIIRNAGRTSRDANWRVSHDCYYSTSWGVLSGVIVRRSRRLADDVMSCHATARQIIIPRKPKAWKQVTKINDDDLVWTRSVKLDATRNHHTSESASFGYCKTFIYIPSLAAINFGRTTLTSYRTINGPSRR